MKPLAPAIVAEFIGTFALCFFGIGAIVSTGGDLMAAALAHGLVLCVFIAGCLYISGAQFNPAVSIGLVFAGKQGPFRAGVFIVTQVVAAVCGAALVQLLVGADTPAIVNTKLGATQGLFTTMTGTFWKVAGLEAVAAFALMFVILSSVADERAHKLAGFPIGLTVTVCILAIGRFTGASMNPARTLGPAIVGNHWSMWYAYMIGPVVGACVAALVYRLFWVDRWSKPA